MGYFFSNEDKMALKKRILQVREKISQLLEKKNEYLFSLSAHKNLFFSFLFKDSINKLESKLSLVDNESSYYARILDLLVNFQVEVNNLIVAMRTGSNELSIFDPSVYSKCSSLFQIFRVYLNSICNDSLKEMNADKLENYVVFMREMVKYFQTVNFCDLSYDYKVFVDIDDYDLLDMYYSFYEFVCACFLNKICYEDFVIVAKKYLTIYSEMTPKSAVKTLNLVKKS